MTEPDHLAAMRDERRAACDWMPHTRAPACTTPAEADEADDGNFYRGLMYALPLSLAFWGAAAGAWLTVVHCWP